MTNFYKHFSSTRQLQILSKISSCRYVNSKETQKMFKMELEPKEMIEQIDKEETNIQISVKFGIHHRLFRILLGVAMANQTLSVQQGSNAKNGKNNKIEDFDLEQLLFSWFA